MKTYTSRSHHAENISTTESLSDSPAMDRFEICQEETSTLLVAKEAIDRIPDPVAYFGQFGKIEQFEHIQSAQE